MQSHTRSVALISLLVSMLPAASSATSIGAQPAASDPAPTAFDLRPSKRADPYGPRSRDATQLTLSQIIRFALQNPAIDAASAEVETMQAQLRKAKFAWLPIVETEITLSPGVYIRCDDIRLEATGDPDGFDFQYCRSRDSSVDINTIKGYFGQLSKAGVRVQWNTNMLIPITTFGKIRHLKRSAQAAVALRKLKKLQTQQETILRVQQAWTALHLAHETKAILHEAKTVVDAAKRRVQADLGHDEDDWDADPEAGNLQRDPDDLRRVKLTALEVEQDMREALRAESLARSALWALAGRAAPKYFDVLSRPLAIDAVDGGLKDLADYKTQAALHRPEARMAAAASTARRAQEKVARANFLPDLGVAMRFSYAVSTSADNDMKALYYMDSFNYTRLSAALALRWRWDFHNKVFDLQAARATRRAAESQEMAARLLLGRDVEQAYADVVEARHRLTLNTEAVELSWALVVSAEIKDSVGGGNTEQLLRALEKWYRRRFEHVQAVGDHNDAVSRLSRAIGTQLSTTAMP